MTRGLTTLQLEMQLTRPTRLESATKDCGVDILIGEKTAEKVVLQSDLEYVGTMSLKGKEELLKVYTV